MVSKEEVYKKYDKVIELMEELKEIYGEMYEETT